MSRLKKMAGAVLLAAVMVPTIAAASPACQGCRDGCEAAYPDQYSDQFLQCFASCYDENGFACQAGA